jgi:acetylornithine aminotransferase
VVAVLLEPLQGEGGVAVPDPDYLYRVRRICDDQGWLLMLDEVQTGMCRTGRWFAYQHSGILPDVVTLAKGLANGVPIGVCLARGAAAEVFRTGNHGSTFGGNPLACRAALAVIRTLEQQALADRAASLGKRLTDGLRTALRDQAGVVSIRGLGLIIGIELARPCGELVGMALKQHLLINVTAERVIRLLPPLVMSDDEADQVLIKLTSLIREFLS